MGQRPMPFLAAAVGRLLRLPLDLGLAVLAFSVKHYLDYVSWHVPPGP